LLLHPHNHEKAHITSVYVNFAPTGWISVKFNTGHFMKVCQETSLVCNVMLIARKFKFG